MTASVTSISKVRAAARDRAERIRMNSRTSTTLLVVVVVLVVIGLGATQSASSAIALDDTQDRFFYFKRQLLGVGLGTIALLVASRIPYRVYRKLALPSFFLTVGLLVAVLMMGDRRGGATRWLEVGGISFQPSELAKVTVVFVLAYLLERKHKLLARFSHLIVPLVATVGVVGVLVMRQPDLGTLIVIGAAAMAVVMASDSP
ncbi:MAG TPA: FtsW/RodA/SpoVE family cell cycle protein, partial [Acidimicrobiia bacterium]